ncbi:hypothetical protein BJV82DRAFT_600144 [Fennellomyces sp. T-0311]|nr:hypothetical protein BJV82DRAFT_600144 [Fennellomyces sp. T-0311]
MCFYNFIGLVLLQTEVVISLAVPMQSTLTAIPLLSHCCYYCHHYAISFGISDTFCGYRYPCSHRTTLHYIVP